jgi:hemin uptake protein HemP
MVPCEPLIPPSQPVEATPLQLSATNRPLVLNSAELLRGQREVWIQHGNEIYRLIHTRNGKLILQK